MITCGRNLYARSRSACELLAHLEPGLVLDVGAAAGGFTTHMSRLSPNSRVVAFEPFPGNWPLLERAVAGLSQVTIDKRAVSDEDGVARLYVSKVVKGDEKGWSDKVGYSSSGRLVKDDDPLFSKALDVETVRLDGLVDERVRFMKIDVQGAELAVLRGAKDLFDHQAVDFMWVEFTGDEGVLDLLRRYDFVAFDSAYVLVPRDGAPAEDEWEIVGSKRLSSGRRAFVAWPREYPRSGSKYCEWLRSLRTVFVAAQTDITFVRRDFLPSYYMAAGAAMSRLSAPKVRG